MMDVERKSSAGVKGGLVFLLLIGWISCQAHGIRIPEPNSRSAQVHQTGSLTATAVFAMGSFWRGEAMFGCLPGVVRTRVGYCGGTKVNPDYHNVGDHAESVEVEYDPTIIRYEQLLDVFWSNHDPSQVFGQGPDVGEQYRSVIFIKDKEDSFLAHQSREREQLKLGERTAVTTQLQSLPVFYPAEREHQKFELRRNTSLLQFLGDLSDDELVTSTTAAKLNSYAAGLCPKSVHKLIYSKVTPLLESRPKLLQLFGD